MKIKKYTKKIYLLMCLAFILLPTFFIKADNNLIISKELTEKETQHVNQRIDFLWNTPWKLWINYHKAHDDLNFRERLAGGILEIDDIINYLVLIIKFLSQLWLLIWTIFIMYAWYKYMISVFNSGKTPSSTIKNAIIWVLIIIFSYAIMKIFTSFIWLT